MRLNLIVYDDLAGKWRWRLRAANGRNIASSGEAFDNKANAKLAARRMRALMHDWLACPIKIDQTWMESK